MANGNKASNVSVGKPAVGGAIFKAPKGTTLPTDATSTLDTAFVNLGFISEDGVTNNNSSESGEIKAWGGSTVYNYLASKTDTFQFKLIECLNVDVLKTVFGEDNVTGDIDTGITVKSTNEDSVACSWVVETILNGGVLNRIVIPEAKLTEVAEIVFKDEEAIGYDCTISAYPDETGVTHYEYKTKTA